MWKRLNILRKNNMLFAMLISLSIFIFVVGYTNVCNASEDMTGIIKISSSYSNIYSRDMTLDLGIDFSQYKYSDNLYLSYHIYDAETGECVVYDNNRKLLDKKSKESKLLISMDVAIPKKIANRKLYISYDILDLDGGTWLSQQEGLLETDVTYYEKNVGKGILQKLQREICSRPIIFAVNIIVCIGALVLVIIIKKKKIYE